MAEPRVEKYTDTAGEHRWRIIAANGETIAASSEGYRDSRDRDHSLELALDALDGPDEGEPHG